MGALQLLEPNGLGWASKVMRMRHREKRTRELLLVRWGAGSLLAKSPQAFTAGIPINAKNGSMPLDGTGDARGNRLQTRSRDAIEHLLKTCDFLKAISSELAESGGFEPPIELLTL